MPAVLAVSRAFGSAVLLLLLLLAPESSAQVAVYRINSGGPAYTDTSGKSWAADGFFNTGSSYTASGSVSGAADPTIYLSERWDAASGAELQYSLPLASGSYTVRLHFASIDDGLSQPGQRVFDVSIEGALVLDDFDIVAQAGHRVATVREFVVAVSDGTLNVAFGHVVQNPKISGIEVLSSPPASGNPPVITSSPPTAASVGAPYSYDVDASDPDPGDVLTFSLPQGPASASIDPSSGLISWTPGAAEAGSNPFTVRVTDPNANFAEQPFVVTVVNTPPSISSTPVVSASVGTSYVYQVQASDPDPGDVLSFSFLDAPAGAWINSETGLVIWIPKATQVGSRDFVVSVSDLGGSSDEQAFSVLVGPSGSAQSPPVVTSMAPTTGSVGASYTYDAFGDDPDEGDILSYALTCFPEGATIDPCTGQITWTPTGGQAGANDFTVRVFDQTGLFVDHAFSVSVAGNPPTITSSAPTGAIADQPFSYDVNASDPDPGDVLGFSLQVAPSGATINPGTGLISWTPTAGQVGLQSFTVRVTDSGGLFDEQPFDVNVAPPAQAIYRINAGGPAYTDTLGRTWAADAFFNTGSIYTNTGPVSGTVDPTIYKTQRWDQVGGAELLYSLPLAPGAYTVRLHFASIYDGVSQPGTRVWDVKIESELALDNFDPVAEAGHRVAVVKDFDYFITDGSLQIEFLHQVENPIINGIEVLEGPATTLDPLPAQLGWGHVQVGASGGVQMLELANSGSEDALITRLDFDIVAGVGHDHHVTLGGSTYTGGDEDLSHDVLVNVPAGTSIFVPIEFLPSEFVDNTVSLVFRGNFPPVAVELDGTGNDGSGHPFLHVVIDAPALVVDYDGNGSETVALGGAESHTHEPGRALVAYEWRHDGVLFASTVDTSRLLPLGSHTISLTIFDDNLPAETLLGSREIVVAPLDQVPGVLALFYDPQGGDPAALLNALPANADRVAQLSGFLLENTPLGPPVMARLLANVEITSTASYEFVATGGASRVLRLDGVPISGAQLLSPGSYELDARFALGSSGELPLAVMLAQGAGAPQPIATSALHHDLGAQPPVLNGSSSTQGAEFGGNPVTISGLGFFLENEVVVHWGDTDLSGGDLTVTPTTIDLVTPPGLGQIPVTVETPRGISNSFEYTYSVGGPLPIEFALRDLATGISSPTTIALGPDERLYVGTATGQIHVLTLDDNLNVTSQQVVNAIAALANPTILGIAFNPFEAASPARLYVSHGTIFGNGGACFTGSSVYAGQVSVLEGPSFGTVQPLVTNLPVSNHDHAINGLEFDRNGDLYIAVGGNTNAGVAACAIGDLPESPLSAAILRAEISKPGFNGEIIYHEIGTTIENDDQVDGDIVELAPGIDVSPYIVGLRNPYDLVFTTRGLIYATDNGPNAGFGPASTGPATQGPDPSAPDELVLVEFGRYYGHPNRTRGSLDARQNGYYGITTPSLPGIFTQALVDFASSTNGIVEYRANTFNGAMRGNLIAQKWKGITYRVVLNPDGRSVASKQNLPVSLSSLDLTTGPGGVLFGASQSNDKVVVAEPLDTIPTPRVYEITPWRAPAAGGHPFVIGGKNFGTLGNTIVKIDGITATLTSVSATRIRGIVPADPSPDGELKDVFVQTAGIAQTLTKAFRWLRPPGNDPYGWSKQADLPVALGEVAAGVINGKLYVVGEGNDATLSYEIASGTWTSPGTLAQRTFPGHHHAAATFGGKLYLMGGLGDGSEGKVQIYDPVGDAWSLGAAMPWLGGSASAALVGNEIFVCGGIVANATVANCGAYDPLGNSWRSIPNMPVGRNHAAAASDGAKLYVFGGRGLGSGDGNVVANGFNDVQIYDPGTNTWQWNQDPGSPLQPLPQARGGTGNAAFFAGRFYVMGGETQNGPGATPDKVYDRVDIYDPVSNTWSVGPPMPTARHGIYQVIHGSRIWLPGGGWKAGFSSSNELESFAP